MDNLKILSLGRNCIKKIENLDGVADTLEELWMSYNLVEKLVGVDKLVNLRVLYLANNKVKDWAEVERLSSLAKLEDLLLKGCPICEDAKDGSNPGVYRVEVRSRYSFGLAPLSRIALIDDIGLLCWVRRGRAHHAARAGPNTK